MIQHKPRKPASTRKKSLYPERKLMVSCFTWFRLQHPKYVNLLFTIPSESSNKQGRGLTKGIPDSMLAVPRRGAHGLFIEFKYGKNGLSDHQDRAIYDLKSYGYQCEVCYTLESFIEIINAYL